ncbi:uncharacterized protein L201_000063 [Kwoniella dendrophila CBS 6074]|uniref:Uncharacterized protein n=1 Tax=Kwoniella dendrophila CBS 6074 TaxID=1295534 RepID=A0AAX4JJZ5_9TREE
MFTKTISFLTLAALSVSAIVTPTSPDGSTVVKVGDKINALWTVDSTDNWNNLEIQLMTGDNLQMVPLATVATGIDGTKVDSFSFVAPDVSPYSKIYFLQFTNGGATTNVTWTTRFTIAGADGSTTEPTNSTVYSGNTVQWGTGKLLSQVSTEGSSSNSTTSASGSSSNSTTGAGSAVTTIVTSESASASSSASASASAASESISTFTSGTATGSGAKTVAAAAASSSSSSSKASSASRKEIGLGMVVMAGLVGVAML